MARCLGRTQEEAVAPRAGAAPVPAKPEDECHRGAPSATPGPDPGSSHPPSALRIADQGGSDYPLTWVSLQ